MPPKWRPVFASPASPRTTGPACRCPHAAHTSLAQRKSSNPTLRPGAKNSPAKKGKTLAEGIGEVRRAAQILRYYGNAADRETGTVYSSPRSSEQISRHSQTSLEW